MARILVVGGGFAGLSAAARLAKLRHDVTVLERADRPGGRLRGLSPDGEHWTAGPPTVTLPGVFRDLFRKSGRPMTALIDITPAGPRRHVVPRRGLRRGVTVDLPFGTRGAQHDAVVAARGRDAWSPWVDVLGDPWNLLRREVLEMTHGPDSPVEPPMSGRTLTELARNLKDPRLRPLAVDLLGADPRSPAAVAVWHHVERNFGRWRFAGGLPGLADALVTRLGERKVTIETAVPVERPRGDDVVTGVVLEDGSAREADLVVWATGTDPDVPAPPPTRRWTAVRLCGGRLPEDFVVHDRAVVRGWHSGEDRWVLESAAEVNPLTVLREHGMLTGDDAFAVTAVDAPAAHGGVPHPARSPRPGLWLVGGAAAAGMSLEVTGMGTAALAEHIGAAPRR